MPWNCPACNSRLRLTIGVGESAPRRGVIYRCHVCRLELVLDPSGERLVVAPLATDGDTEPPRRQPA